MEGSNGIPGPPEGPDEMFHPAGNTEMRAVTEKTFDGKKTSRCPSMVIEPCLPPVRRRRNPPLAFIIWVHQPSREALFVSEPFPRAPDFQLVDSHGYPVTLSTFRGHTNVVLVLNRGLACPFCRRHLAQLRRDMESFEARRAVILIIDPDRPEQIAEYWEREGLPFPGFADADNYVASLFRQKVDMYGKGRLPSVILIDREGRIRYQHDGISAPDIPSDETLLAELDRINQGPPH
jgi:peroxiredoxin